MRTFSNTRERFFLSGKTDYRKDIKIMKVLDSDFAKSFAKLANDGFIMGYHERNGGNLSYRIPKESVEAVKEELDYSKPFADIGTAVASLAGEYFMVTGTGQYFQNVLERTEETSGIIEIDSTGTKYRIVWGFSGGGRPTSELPSHLMNHEVKMLATNGKHRVIYHCHPANVIAMTFLLPIDDKIFTRELWESMTECPMIFPSGVGVIPWMVPGGREIAVATSEKMKKYDVAIWAHHGIFCSGDTFDSTFGLAHTVEKSAEIYIKVRSVTDKKLQTITTRDFIALARDFGIDLSEEMLK